MGEAAQTFAVEDEALAKIGEYMAAISVADAGDRGSTWTAHLDRALSEGTDVGGLLVVEIAGEGEAWWKRQRHLWGALVSEWLHWFGSEPSGTSMAIGSMGERHERAGVELGTARDHEVETELVLKPSPRRRYEVTLEVSQVRRGTLRFVEPE